MIRKISDQWEEIKEGVRPVESSDTEQLQKIVRQIGSVRDALRTMCKVSVSRTTVKNAVREALIPVIQEHRDELFPEMLELRRRLNLADDDPSVLDVYRGESPDQVAAAQAAEEFRHRLESFESRISEMDSAVHGELTEVQSDLSAVKSDLTGVDAKVGAVEGGLAQVQSSVDHQVGAVQHRIDEVQDTVTRFEEHLGRIETSIPEQAKSAASEVEARLRKEIEEMVEQLSGRLAELREMLGRVEQSVPSKEQLAAVDERLGRIEQSFESVSQQVTTIESSTSTTEPEIVALSGRFQEVRELISSATDRLHSAGEDVGVAVRTQIGTRLDELECALRDGIRRWEADQSEVSENLSHLRDALRDQLQDFSRQVEGSQGSFWGKLTGKKDPGLKLSAEEFDALSEKFENVIGGLEGVISHRKAGDEPAAPTAAQHSGDEPDAS